MRPKIARKLKNTTIVYSEFRRVLRLRSKKPCDAGDTDAEAGEGGGIDGEAEYEPPEKRDEEDGGLMDTDDCHVCPGTEAPPCFHSFPHA